jgi:LacI family transcriptional regulator
MSSLKDVAERAGVSTATISRVLNGSGFVSPELRDRVLAAVEALNYSPDGVARSMASHRRRTLTVGLVVDDITNPFFTAVARGVEDTAQDRGYSLMLCNSDQDVAKERSYLRVLREKRVDGVLLAVSGHEVQHIQRLAEAGMKIVLFDRAVPDLHLPTVCVDNVAGAYEATQHLIRLGHTRIGILTGGLDVGTARERLDGYLAALKEAGVPGEPAFIVSGHFTETGGYTAGRALWEMPRRPTAILSSNNVMTTGLLMALRDRGARVPRDVSLISFDDLPYFSLLDHPLTVVAQPMYDLGQRACDLLLNGLADGKPSDPPALIRLPTKLIVRDSCRPPDGSRTSTAAPDSTAKGSDESA